MVSERLDRKDYREEYEKVCNRLREANKATAEKESNVKDVHCTVTAENLGG